MSSDPKPVSALQPLTPPTLDRLIGTCLAKDPDDRWQGAGDLARELKWIAETGRPVVAPQRRRVALVGAAAAVATAAIIGTVVWAATHPAEPVPLRVSRLQVTASGSAALTINGRDRDLAITPDGSRLVYVGNNGTQLFVRALDALEPLAVFTGAPAGPFVSPDGQWIGFADGYSVLKKVAVAGGPAVTLGTLAAF